MAIKILPFLLLSFLLSFDSVAQKMITHQSLYWVRYINQLTINEKWTWQNEIDNRRFLKSNRQHHLIIHSRLHYKIFKNSDFAFGFTYSLQSPQDPNATASLVVPELRPVQEINLYNPLSIRFTLQQRLRIDERFIHKNNELILVDGYNFNFRFRYKLQANYEVTKKDAKNKTVVKIADEVMINAGKNIIYNSFDQNRIYVAVEQGINKHISVELGYLHWFQQRTSGYQFFERDIVRFTLYHKIKLLKKMRANNLKVSNT